MRKGVLVIGEITLPLVGGIVIAEHDCVEIRHTHPHTHPTILHVFRPCNTQPAGYTSLVVTTSPS
ncbi:MAG TPA: hypothetical protein VJ643_03185 [Nitrososphaera sp.]|nr:hypothetical protein [Nitrososphaera sp.]